MWTTTTRTTRTTRWIPTEEFTPGHKDPGPVYSLPWAWGSAFRNTRFNGYHRVAEAGFDYNNPNNLSVFVEHKDVFGLTVQGRVNNILEGEAVLLRTVHAGPRSTAPMLFAEDRRREIGKVINFTVKGNF